MVFLTPSSFIRIFLFISNLREEGVDEIWLCFLNRTFVALAREHTIFDLIEYLLLYDFGTQNWKIDEITSMQSSKFHFFSLKGLEVIPNSHLQC